MKDEPAKPALEYEQQAAFVSRRQYRRLMALTLLNTVLLAGFVIGPTFGPFVKTQWQQFQRDRKRRAAEVKRQADLAAARTYTAPADQVMYEERPEEAEKLLAAQPEQYRTIRRHRGVYLTPRPWQPPVQRMIPDLPHYKVQDDEVILFLHARTNRRGHERLIQVVLTDGRQETQLSQRSADDTMPQTFRVHTSYSLLAHVVDDDASRPSASQLVSIQRPEEMVSEATWTRGPNDWDHGQVEFNPRGLFRFYPGQVDPNDASRFTIDYELDGVRGTIDGQFLDDDEIRLVPRKGAIVSHEPDWQTFKWNPVAATQPSPP